MRLPYFLLLLVAQLWHPYRRFPVRWLWAAARVMVELPGASVGSVLGLMEIGRMIRESDK